MRTAYYSIIICLHFLWIPLFADVPALERLVSLNCNNMQIETVLNSISEQAGVIFSYNTNIIADYKPVTIKCYQRPVRWVLATIFGTKINLKQRGQYIILLKNENQTTKNIIIEGYITESSTGKILSNATVYDRKNLFSATTNQYGYFKLIIPAKDTVNQLVVSKSGYDQATIKPIVVTSGNVVTVSLTDRLIDSVLVPTINIFPKWMLPEKLTINANNITDSVFRAVNISLLPFLGTNRLLTGSVSNNVSINATVGYSQEINTAEVGGLINIVTRNVRNCQVAGLGNIVGGNVYGFQGAGIFNIAKSVHGCQAAGTINLVEDAQGLQLAGSININKRNAIIQSAGLINFAAESSVLQSAGIVNYSGNSKIQISGFLNFGKQINGLQISGFSNVADNVLGLQIAGLVNNVAKDANTQIAGFTNHSESISGIQVSGFLNTAKVVKGSQIAGFLNIANSVTGSQVSGFLNVSKEITGTQLSVINISDSCNGLPVGILSYVTKGYHVYEISADELFPINVGFRSGVKKFFTQFSVGVKTNPDSIMLWNCAFGVGSMLKLNNNYNLEANILRLSIFQNANFDFENSVYRFYAGVDRKFLANSSLAFGLTYSIVAINSNSNRYIDALAKLTPYHFTNYTTTSGINYKTYLGFRIAFRM